jgi:hypothetical protein
MRHPGLMDAMSERGGGWSHQVPAAVEPDRVETWELHLAAIERSRYRLVVNAPDGRGWVREGPDVFQCLLQLRRELESLGVRLCCNGARRDAWPAWPGGLSVFLHEGVSWDARPPEARTLDETPPELAVTVAEQLEWQQHRRERLRNDIQTRVDPGVAGRLPSYRIAGWEGPAVGGFGALGSSRRGGMTGWTFRDKLGRSVEVESNGVEGTDLAELRRRTVSNLVYSYARAKLGPDAISYDQEAQAVEREVVQGDRVWQPATIEIDGTPTLFDVLVLGQGYWVAVGQSPDVLIALRSHGVPLTDIALVRGVTP